MLCLGIHGQMVYVNRATRLVGVKLVVVADSSAHGVPRRHHQVLRLDREPVSRTTTNSVPKPDRRAARGHHDARSLTHTSGRAKTREMTRYGQQFGPDFTFLGVPMCDLDDPSTYADAQVVILGAPFDGGTSGRSGARYGPMAIRMRDYLPHDGERPSLALRTDGLKDLGVVDAGDVEMYSGDIEVALPALEAAVEKVTRSARP